jgi:hypothetical protein
MSVPPLPPNSSSDPTADADPRVGAVRDELRRLGYLSHRLDRYLLQDALRPQHGAGTLARLAAKVGLLIGLPAALAAAAALAFANGGLGHTPLDLLPLTLHLLPLFALTTGVGTFLLCLAITLLLRLRPVRRVEPLSLSAATVVGLLTMAAGLWFGRDLLAEAQTGDRVLLALAVPLLTWALVRVLYDALLALTIRLTELAPSEAVGLRGRWIAVIVGGTAAFALVALLLLPRPSGAAAPVFLPSQPGENVLLVGVDGALPAELDYLLARGDMPNLAGLLAGGGVLGSYRRPELPAAAFWTTVATGLPAPAHGVISYDSFRPLGVTTPLARVGPLRHWWARVAVPLHLCEYRPLLASRRRAWAFWELASRGGRPVVAVDWWSTWPAEPLAGAVVAHGAYQLMAADPGASIAPASWVSRLATLRGELAGDEPGAADVGPTTTLPPASAADVELRALAPDRFYRAATEQLATAVGEPVAVAVYLPALDLAADRWAGSDVAFSDLVRQELVAADRLLGRLASGRATVVMVVDPGRRGGGEGRVLLWRRTGCQATPGPPPELLPESLASGLLRALGLPQSTELPPPPAVCPWPSPPATLPSFGERVPQATSGAAGDEYLKNLESLGYL